MFSLRRVDNADSDRWSEVSIQLSRDRIVLVSVLEELGDILGFFARAGRIVINTASGIPVIACAATKRELKDAIVNVKKHGIET